MYFLQDGVPSSLDDPALVAAAEVGRTDLIRQACICSTIPEHDWGRILQAASKAGHVDVIDVLARWHPPKREIFDFDRGWSATLQIAAKHVHVNAVKRLLDAGAFGAGEALRLALEEQPCDSINMLDMRFETAWILVTSTPKHVYSNLVGFLTRHSQYAVELVQSKRLSLADLARTSSCLGQYVVKWQEEVHIFLYEHHSVPRVLCDIILVY